MRGMERVGKQVHKEQELRKREEREEEIGKEWKVEQNGTPREICKRDRRF